MNLPKNDPIIALASPSGVGAVAVIRLSGPQVIDIADTFLRFKNPTKSLSTSPSHSIHLGNVIEGERLIDEVLVSVFKEPHSYTGENVVEINCHGSAYIQQEIIQLFIRNGLRHAEPGEFTLRAFLQGKMDLSQAEAVADLIASKSAAAHQIALQQMRGGFSHDIEQLRQQLVDFASLLELELDFSEEDVTFADRSALTDLLDKIAEVLKRLIDSFSLGNVLKDGIPIAIAGAPNVGKSTLLNALLNEEKAIVSDIAGTTRDAIEDEINVGGIAYRFIDTAGIRHTEDSVEQIGIQKTFEKIAQAQLVIYLIDLAELHSGAVDLRAMRAELDKIRAAYPAKALLLLANKADLVGEKSMENVRLTFSEESLLFISAKERTGLAELCEALGALVDKGALSNQETIVSNARHYEALTHAYTAVKEVQKGLGKQLSTDLLAIDIRQALYHLGEITGKVTADDLLGNIFANFCIGK
ncbi:MAG: tRNA uridine-5-carboxymethylaminomethyl(34) synthesis GTPase MnmE [Lutibacter sp.]|nr:tRNA uridine-5-carboxymethylaminomethyl(34) synthesis GTPase MnmE [Lutibacter sp.]